MDDKSQNIPPLNLKLKHPPKKRGLPYLIGGLLVVVVAVLIIFLTISRSSSEKKQAEQLKSEVALGPVVRTASVIVSPPEDSIMVEGDARPYESATLYSKLSGYLRSI